MRECISLLEADFFRTAATVALIGAVPTIGCDGRPREELSPPPTDSSLSLTRPERLESLLSVLAADAMAGRRTGTPGARQASQFLAAQLERYGIEPAGDDGYFQNIPLAWIARFRPSSRVSVDSYRNVVGILRGSDARIAADAVVVGAHYDHVGGGVPIEDPVEGLDSIYNGADDNGSGTVAVLEIARTLAQAEPLSRTVIFLLSTGEEMGLLGTRWYIANPVVPLDRTVADLQIEMIGRPDSLAGGAGYGWLSGYERTTMGEQLARAGLPIVPDPRREQGFYFRSDNIAFARRGIPAHTLSSYNLHNDYHQVSDEVDRIDFHHLAALVDVAVEAVRHLAEGPAPEWVEGGQEGLSTG